MLANTQEFRREALRFEKYGSYITAPRGSDDYKQYWDEQKRRCLEGYKVADTYISGYHYFYLNFCRIRLVSKAYSDGEQTLSKAKRADWKENFPHFWDLDYEWFNLIEQAEIEGKHLVCLKARGKGFSFKGGAMLARNYFLIPNSRSYAFAAEKEYLIRDGLLSKAWEFMEFIDNNTAWRKNRQKKDDIMHRRASYIEDGIEKGYKSEVIGVTLKDNPDKARGKRGKLILWEEFGSFPHALHAWEISRPSVEQGDYVAGTMIAFGTGGETGPGFEAMERMFYSPEAFNCIAVPNIWDKDRPGTKCGYFVPNYICNEGFIDADGNSLIDEAIKSDKEKRALKKEKAKNALELSRYIAERPHNPAEAILAAGLNLFPAAEIKSWRDHLMSLGEYKNLAVPGHLVTDPETGIKFFPNTNLQPINEFPTRPGMDTTGCVVIYQSPYRDPNTGRPPPGLYIIAHDPYAHDETMGKSLGAAYVIKMPNFFSKPDDMIVASYVGRPPTQDEYNRNLFALAEYYNAKIGFENDRGATIQYAKRFRKLRWLEEEFELNFNENIPKTSARRKYGMHIASGPKDPRKKQGELYLADWLIHPRGKGTDGSSKLNLHTIYDIGLLDELIRYNPEEGNFDRVSAMIIGMYYMHELSHRNTEAMTQQVKQVSDPESFWNRPLFVD